MAPHAVSIVVALDTGCTTIVTVPLSPLAVAVTLAEPTLTAVTTPLGETVAIPGESDVQATPVAAAPELSEAVNWLVSPARKAVGPEIVRTAAGGLVVLAGALGFASVLEEQSAAPASRLSTPTTQKAAGVMR
jgi:hypothetical protein